MPRKSKIHDVGLLTQSVASSCSVAESLAKMGLRPSGGNFETFKRACKLYGIITAHFTGQGYLKSKKRNWPKVPLIDLLRKGVQVNTHTLRKRLIQEGIKEHRCEDCGGKEWKGGPIPLELHHEDGDRTNNELTNIFLFCPNCHALTPNYRGKKKKKPR